MDKKYGTLRYNVPFYYLIGRNLGYRGVTLLKGSVVEIAHEVDNILDILPLEPGYLSVCVKENIVRLFNDDENKLASLLYG